MRITNWGIIFLMVMLPGFLMLQWNDEDSRKAMWLSEKYDQALTSAVEDAIFKIRINEDPNYESSYNSMKYTKVDKEDAINTFFNTLYINFKATEDPISQSVLKEYVPVVGIIDYDGLLLNVYQEYTADDGMLMNERVWLPKIPFSYEDEEGNVFSFTVDETYMRVYAADSGRWYEGNLEQIFSDMTLFDKATRTWSTDKSLIQSVPILAEFADANGEPIPSRWLDKNNIRESTLDKIRRETIVSTVQEHLAYYINEHNTFTRKQGINYTFIMPTIPEETWNNTVDDISIFAFIQGVPITKTQTYNNYSLVGARVQKNLQFEAGEWNGKKVYYREDTKLDTSDVTVTHKFTTAVQAAKEGFYPLDQLVAD